MPASVFVLFERSFDPFVTTNGVLGGLVAITASSPMVETHGAFIIGLVSGALVFYGSKLLLKLKARHGELVCCMRIESVVSCCLWLRRDTANLCFMRIESVISCCL